MNGRLDLKFDVTNNQWHFMYFNSINDPNEYEFPQSTRRSCARTYVHINTAPRVSGEPSGNNLVLISKKR